ncbi:hypothetical protein J4474_01785 [Candidatus Pacearchaeota archaeon]|nr:hypothetical protein [Candidatus Pacearchaeota archaeon]
MSFYSRLKEERKKNKWNLKFLKNFPELGNFFDELAEKYDSEIADKVKGIFLLTSPNIKLQWKNETRRNEQDTSYIISALEGKILGYQSYGRVDQIGDTSYLQIIPNYEQQNSGECVQWVYMYVGIKCNPK